MASFAEEREHYRPTKCAAEIVLPNTRRFRTKVVVEPVRGVEGAVPEIVVGRAVPLIRARFRFKRELPAGIAPVFRGVSRALDAKFLKIVHGDEGLRRSQS